METVQLWLEPLALARLKKKIKLFNPTGSSEGILNASRGRTKLNIRNDSDKLFVLFTRGQQWQHDVYQPVIKSKL